MTIEIVNTGPNIAPVETKKETTKKDLLNMTPQESPKIEVKQRPEAR